MRIYIDCEFVEDGRTIDLISIALVADDGREYYAIIKDDDTISRAVAHPWLRENVMPSLPVTMASDLVDGWWWDASHPDQDRIKTRAEIADDVRQFILSHPDPQLWAWYAAYGHVALAQLFGRMIDLPDGIPMRTGDLKQECARLGNPHVPQQESGQHNALADARHNRVIAEFLDQLAAQH